MSERQASIIRTTERAEVKVILNMSGKGEARVETGLPFLDRMLALLARYSGFDLTVQCRQNETDPSGIVEEVAGCLGLALDKVLGEKKGPLRSGHSYSPVEENLVRAVIEISGHPCLVYHVRTPSPSPMSVDADMVERFWRAFVSQARANLHIELLYGGDGLAACEAIFKAAGRALNQACRAHGGPG
jgi:imidazoleglycerol-phosphate dehydratase